MSPFRTLRIRFANDDADETIEIAKTTTVEDLLKQIRTLKKWPESKNIRLIGAGQEAVPESSIQSLQSDVLLCQVSDHAPSKSRQTLTPSSPNNVDWLDRMNPVIVVMCIIGSVLTLLWILFFMQRSFFDTSATGLLALLTLAFIFPCLSFYLSDATLRSSTSYDITRSTLSSRAPTDMRSANDRQVNSSYGYQISSSPTPQFRNISSVNTQS